MSYTVFFYTAMYSRYFIPHCNLQGPTLVKMTQFLFRGGFISKCASVEATEENVREINFSLSSSS